MKRPRRTCPGCGEKQVRIPRLMFQTTWCRHCRSVVGIDSRWEIGLWLVLAASFVSALTLFNMTGKVYLIAAFLALWLLIDLLFIFVVPLQIKSPNIDLSGKLSDSQSFTLP